MSGSDRDRSEIRLAVVILVRDFMSISCFDVPGLHLK